MKPKTPTANFKTVEVRQMTQMDCKQRENYQEKLKSGIEKELQEHLQFRVRKMSGIQTKIRNSTQPRWLASGW